jgi:anti-anti-sigma factor
VKCKETIDMAIGERREFAVTRTTDDDGVVVVGLEGEIDIATAPLVWDAIAAALAEHDGRVVVDFSEVSFLDSQGIRALFMVNKDRGIEPGRLVLRAPQPQVRRVFELTALDTILPIEP